ncbi:hypothetical protein MK079_03975 [Candidatus Gracilibacteria bacterium]|nr:hypothetical protein [Candidatus Gracilibacteria bacterium]
MANIQTQGIRKISSLEKDLLPDLKALQIGTKYAKKIIDLPAYLGSQLSIVANKNPNCSIQDDGYGWSYLVHSDTRISLALAIINKASQSVFIYNRNGNQASEQNTTFAKDDIIGSKGYMVNSISDKLPQDFWAYKITSAYFSDQIAYETTDENGDCKNIVMPILLVEIEENLHQIDNLIMTKIKDINNPTSKTSVVIRELSK